MKSSTFLIVLLINVGASIAATDTLSLLSTLGSTLVPTLCNTFNNNAVPDVVQDIYDQIVDGLSCQTSCTTTSTANGEYHFLGICDSSNFSDTDKATNCKNGVKLMGGVAKLLGCPEETVNCVVNADGNIVYTSICPPSPIKVPIPSLSL